MRQNTASLTMADALRFLCDEMLAGLGRWLRIAGYDTAIAARGCRDRDLVEQAHAEQRILLTRDRRLVEIRRANEWTIVLNGNGIDACARELGRRLALDWTFDPLSRCTLCNTRLDRADPRLLASLPCVSSLWPPLLDASSTFQVELAGFWVCRRHVPGVEDVR